MDKARAVIVERSRILLIKRVKPDATYWVFPGGSIEGDETPELAVARECREELGVEVAIGGLFVSERSTDPRTPGVTEHFFRCRVAGGTLGDASGPEYAFGTHYVGNYELVWVPLAELAGLDLRPHGVRDRLAKLG